MASKTFNWEILSLTRFLLAFVVVIGHLTAFTNVGLFKILHYLGSFEAILGFLLISGLSIGKSILRNKESYFQRRIKRIYPVYLASIVFTCIVLPQPFTWTYAGFILLNLVFLNQALTSTSLVGPAWTLAVEVWMYSLAPVFLKMSMKKLNMLIYISFISYCIYTCGRTLFKWDYYAGTSYGINLLLLSFIWIAGFTMAIFPDKKKSTSMHIAAIFVLHIALKIAIQVLFRYKHHELGLIVSNDLPGFIGIIVCLAWVYYVVIYNHKVPVFSSPVNKVLNLLGNISYPLYLVHLTLFKQLDKWNISNVFLMIGSALLFSWLVYYVFDFYSKKREAKFTASSS